MANRQAEVLAAQKDLDFTKKTYQIELDTTMGKILLDMYPDVAPGHVKNILGLTKIGFYDGIVFHRIIPNFMIQVGCPLGNGTGGPGYTIKQ
ncbi:MAG: peptidyl-prolyl cis-trans isomerase cyclophilin type, partial [Planctomycetaceae bacterium]|nr:peptidyl-prolyl cis-trans isomerase cyclophilin type [Planctomycetaceae bacterium]